MMNDAPPSVQLRHEYTIVSPENTTIASATIEKMHNVFWMTNVWVHHEHRRKGYATAIITEVIQDFGSAEIWLNVHPYTDRPLSTGALTKWYAKFGFVRADTPGAMVRRPK